VQTTLASTYGAPLKDDRQVAGAEVKPVSAGNHWTAREVHLPEPKKHAYLV
jgi:hypothetical protein